MEGSFVSEFRTLSEPVNLLPVAAPHPTGRQHGQPETQGEKGWKNEGQIQSEPERVTSNRRKMLQQGQKHGGAVRVWNFLKTLF